MISCEKCLKYCGMHRLLYHAAWKTQGCSTKCQTGPHWQKYPSFLKYRLQSFDQSWTSLQKILPFLSISSLQQAWAQFCCKMWGAAWCETNIVIGSMQKWRFLYADSQSYFYRCFESNNNHALLCRSSLQMIYILIYSKLLLDLVL